MIYFKSANRSAIILKLINSKKSVRANCPGFKIWAFLYKARSELLKISFFKAKCNYYVIICFSRKFVLNLNYNTEYGLRTVRNCLLPSLFLILFQSKFERDYLIMPIFIVRNYSESRTPRNHKRSWRLAQGSYWRLVLYIQTFTTWYSNVFVDCTGEMKMAS